MIHMDYLVNSGPTEPGYVLLLQTADPGQLASEKPADLDLQCLSFIM